MPFVVLSLTLAMVVCGVVTVVVQFGLAAYKAPDRRPARKDGVQFAVIAGLAALAAGAIGALLHTSAA